MSSAEGGAIEDICDQWFRDFQDLRKVLFESRGFLSGSWLLAKLLKIHGREVPWDTSGCGVDLFVPGEPPIIRGGYLVEPDPVVLYLYSEGYKPENPIIRDDLKVLGFCRPHNSSFNLQVYYTGSQHPLKTMMKMYPLSVLFNVMTWRGVYSLFPKLLVSGFMFALQLDAKSLGSLHVEEFIGLYTTRGFVELSPNDPNIDGGLVSKGSDVRRFNDKLSWSRRFYGNLEIEEGWQGDSIAEHAIKLTSQEGKWTIRLVSKKAGKVGGSTA